MRVTITFEPLHALRRSLTLEHGRDPIDFPEVHPSTWAAILEWGFGETPKWIAPWGELDGVPLHADDRIREGLLVVRWRHPLTKATETVAVRVVDR